MPGRCGRKSECWLDDITHDAVIAYCQGEHGWDDYLLLDHFDPTVQLDDSGLISHHD